MSMLSQPVGKLARELPGATQIFHLHGIDFCCGGKRNLEEAIDRAGVSTSAVLEALHALSERQQSEPCRWEEQPDAELIEHILRRYHQVHREQLIELIRMAERVEQVHADHPECPRGLGKYLRGLKAELELHMQKEENVLFPLILKSQTTMARGPIAVMQKEHDEHALAISGLLHLSHDTQPPKGACNTWRALYTGIASFISDLKQHIHLENNVLFERQQASPKKEDCCGHCC